MLLKIKGRVGFIRVVIFEADHSKCMSLKMLLLWFLMSTSAFASECNLKPLFLDFISKTLSSGFVLDEKNLSDSRAAAMWM